MGRDTPSIPRSSTSVRTGHGGGLTLVELLLVSSVLLVALLFFSRSMGSAIALTEVNRESAVAMNAARDLIERMQGEEDFSQLFVRYNDAADDDPGGPGTAPGSGFPVRGLRPAEDDPDGLVGEVRFPTVAAGVLELHEDLEDQDFGTPRDLTGDGQVDADDHADDYRLLPVHVVLRWTGQTGVRSLEVHTLLADR